MTTCTTSAGTVATLHCQFRKCFSMCGGTGGFTSIEGAAEEPQLGVVALLGIPEQHVITLGEHILKSGALQLTHPRRAGPVPVVNLAEDSHIQPELLAHHLRRRLHLPTLSLLDCTPVPMDLTGMLDLCLFDSQLWQCEHANLDVQLS